MAGPSKLAPSIPMTNTKNIMAPVKPAAPVPLMELREGRRRRNSDSRSTPRSDSAEGRPAGHWKRRQDRKDDKDSTKDERKETKEEKDSRDERERREERDSRYEREQREDTESRHNREKPNDHLKSEEVRRVDREVTREKPKVEKESVGVGVGTDTASLGVSTYTEMGVQAEVSIQTDTGVQADTRPPKKIKVDKCIQTDDLEDYQSEKVDLKDMAVQSDKPQERGTSPTPPASIGIQVDDVGVGPATPPPSTQATSHSTASSCSVATSSESRTTTCSAVSTSQSTSCDTSVACTSSCRVSEPERRREVRSHHRFSHSIGEPHIAGLRKEPVVELVREPDIDRMKPGQIQKNIHELSEPPTTKSGRQRHGKKTGHSGPGRPPTRSRYRDRLKDQTSKDSAQQEDVAHVSVIKRTPEKCPPQLAAEDGGSSVAKRSLSSDASSNNNSSCNGELASQDRCPVLYARTPTPEKSNSPVSNNSNTPPKCPVLTPEVLTPEKDRSTVPSPSPCESQPPTLTSLDKCLPAATATAALPQPEPRPQPQIHISDSDNASSSPTKSSSGRERPTRESAKINTRSSTAMPVLESQPKPAKKPEHCSPDRRHKSSSRRDLSPKNNNNKDFVAINSGNNVLEAGPIEISDDEVCLDCVDLQSKSHKKHKSRSRTRHKAGGHVCASSSDRTKKADLEKSALAKSVDTVEPEPETLNETPVTESHPPANPEEAGTAAVNQLLQTPESSPAVVTSKKSEKPTTETKRTKPGREGKSRRKKKRLLEEFEHCKKQTSIRPSSSGSVLNESGTSKRAHDDRSQFSTDSIADSVSVDSSDSVSTVSDSVTADHPTARDPISATIHAVIEATMDSSRPAQSSKRRDGKEVSEGVAESELDTSGNADTVPDVEAQLATRAAVHSEYDPLPEHGKKKRKHKEKDTDSNYEPKKKKKRKHKGKDRHKRLV